MHPYLYPALLGALIGFAALIFGVLRLARRWKRLRPRTRWIALAALGALEIIYWCNVYAWFIEPERLVVRRVEVESPHWHGPPITIAAIGDTHVGSPHVSARRMERIVARINALKPDIVIALGDYVGGHVRASRRPAAERAEIMNGIAVFAALDAPLGAAAVIGNHDVWFHRGEITRGLEEAGVAVLWDQSVVVQRAGGDFVVVGLEDEITGDPDYREAADGAPAGLDQIVLSHSPDVFPSVPDGVALTLAAHTHCGQVTVPLIGRPIVPSRYGQRYACGLIAENGKQMFVTAGIGTSIFPLRFLNPPEIALITLRGAR